MLWLLVGFSRQLPTKKNGVPQLSQNARTSLQGILGSWSHPFCKLATFITLHAYPNTLSCKEETSKFWALQFYLDLQKTAQTRKPLTNTHNPELTRTAVCYQIPTACDIHIHIHIHVHQHKDVLSRVPLHVCFISHLTRHCTIQTLYTIVPETKPSKCPHVIQRTQ